MVQFNALTTPSLTTFIVITSCFFKGPCLASFLLWPSRLSLRRKFIAGTRITSVSPSSSLLVRRFVSSSIGSIRIRSSSTSPHTSSSSLSLMNNVLPNDTIINEEDDTRRWNTILQTTGILQTHDDAYNLDQDLFSMGFTLEQLMELAGLSVAEAIYKCIPLYRTPSAVDTEMSSDPTTRRSLNTTNEVTRILVVCGPGNNGGDGLVAARHLALYGYHVTVVYPKLSTIKNVHYQKLIQQCQLFHIPIHENMPLRSELLLKTDDVQEHKEGDSTLLLLHTYDCILDAIFGFSFQSSVPIREPYKSCIADMMYAQHAWKTKIISVDIPSGWDVQEGDTTKSGLHPTVLVSLTAPKRCAQFFHGTKHYVGGRFIPPCIAEKYHIKMPPYKGLDQVYDYDDSSKVTVSISKRMSGRH